MTLTSDLHGKTNLVALPDAELFALSSVREFLLAAIDGETSNEAETLRAALLKVRQAANNRHDEIRFSNPPERL